MTSHTKHEWRRDGTLVYSLMPENTGVSRTGLKNRFWFKLYGDKDCPADELEANARLAQAAPALMEALENMWDDWNDGYMPSEVPETCDLMQKAFRILRGEAASITVSDYVRSAAWVDAGDKAFLTQFATMREAWLSEECPVDMMLSMLSGVESNRSRIEAFAQFWCDTAPDYDAARVCAVSAREAVRAAKTPEDVIGQTKRCVRNGAGGNEAVGRAIQRAELRRIFPCQFVGAA